ncbi:MAG TPA: Crp/Fnr family transcriptional regulator [Terriglobia bacterium]|nr:Crp/Fnr family transcriptional regulator [Terriglobia bacterium]
MSFERPKIETGADRANTGAAALFADSLRASIRRDPLSASARLVPRRANVYTAGGRDGNVYLIEKGQVKSVVVTAAGKECVLAVYAANDIFGELCLAGGERAETATAMKETLVRQIPCHALLALLARDGLLAEFVRYLAARAVEQQQIITDLATADSEHRLAATLLRLARKVGQQDPRSLRLEEPPSHQELSEMVGTTRPRITRFMRRLRDRGLIEFSGPFLIVKEHALGKYLGAAISPATLPCASRGRQSESNLPGLSNIEPTAL